MLKLPHFPKARIVKVKFSKTTGYSVVCRTLMENNIEPQTIEVKGLIFQEHLLVEGKNVSVVKAPDVAKKELIYHISLVPIGMNEYLSLEKEAEKMLQAVA